MAVEEPLITDEARALIGRESSVDLGEVTLRDLQRYAAAAGDMNPLYFDEEYAKRSAYGGIIAPPNFLTAIISWEAGPPEAELTLDGRAAAGELSVPLRGVSRAMGAGQELEFLMPVRPGDSFTRVTKIVEIVEREGRSGRFVLTTTEQRYVNQRGEVVVICRASTIMR
ncbi:MAG: MaoC family dehydratase N-terminal domain-containing protein [Dehalococcoidia bacterium]